MRYFLDTESIERGARHPIELLSIALVAEDDREYYAQNIDAHPDSDFVREHVWPHLDNLDYWHHREGVVEPWLTTEDIASSVKRFVGNDHAPEFWGYYPCYDWVVFCQLFGDMGALPKDWPHLCYDLRQALDHEALYHIEHPDDAPHHALLDARWIAETWRAHLNWGARKVAD